MALFPEAAEHVFVAKGPLVARTLGRLLDLDEQIGALGETSSLAATLKAMTIGEAIETLKRLTPLPPRGDLHTIQVSDGRALSTLSERELEVVRLVAEGLSNKKISSRLRLSDKTVKNHLSHILAKMNLTARTQVAVYAIRAGLV